MFTRSKRTVYHFQTLLPELRHWLDSERGQQVLAAEQTHLSAILPRIFGHHACTLGILPDCSLLSVSKVFTQTFLTPLQEKSTGPTVRIAVNEWGIQPRSMDLVLLHHALEFAERPHRMLREACRTIRPGGKLVVVGFNPISIWGGVRLLGFGQDRLMGEGTFYHATRIEDWLTLLNFRRYELRFGSSLFPLLSNASFPFYHSSMREKFSVGALGFGFFYVLVAVKERAGLLPPVGQPWRSQRPFLSSTPACSHRSRCDNHKQS